MRAGKLIAISVATMMIAGATTYAGGGVENEQYYKASIKTPTLGNYEFNLGAFERPSNETLPIINSSYFPRTVAKFTTEVDNTAPSATYKSKPISKVDVVFALGELSQGQLLSEYMQTFKSKIDSASNNIDSRVEQVVTSTIDASSAGAKEILDTWIGFPSGHSWRFDASENAVINGDNPTHETGFINPKTFSAKTVDFKADVRVAEGQQPIGLIFKVHKTNEQLSDSRYNMYFWWASGRYAILFKVEGLDIFRGGMYSATPLDSYADMKLGWRYHLPYNYGYFPAETPLFVGNKVQNDIDPLLKTEILAFTPIKESDNWGNNRYSIQQGWHKIAVSMQGNAIKCQFGDNYISVVDDDSYKQGTVGFFQYSHVGPKFKNFIIQTGETKSLGDAISDVAWRDGSTRFIVHATDVVPDDMKDVSGANFINTVAKLQASNAYLLNLGTSINESTLNNIGRMLEGTDGEAKGVFINNNPITEALDKTAQWIIDKAKGLQKPNDYVLVGEEMYWETQYKDNEKDVPLNFGKNALDKKLAISWGISLTDKYMGDDLLAEKWRYRHDNAFYDNSAVRAPFSGEWLSDSVRVFEQPGVYRVNYKRRDNPVAPNYSLTSIMNSYRYWSTDYDVYKPNN